MLVYVLCISLCLANTDITDACDSETRCVKSEPNDIVALLQLRAARVPAPKTIEVTTPKTEVTTPKTEVFGDLTLPKIIEVTTPKTEVTTPKTEVTTPKTEVFGDLTLPKIIEVATNTNASMLPFIVDDREDRVPNAGDVIQTRSLASAGGWTLADPPAARLVPMDETLPVVFPVTLPLLPFATLLDTLRMKQGRESAMSNEVVEKMRAADDAILGRRAVDEKIMAAKEDDATVSARGYAAADAAIR